MQALVDRFVELLANLDKVQLGITIKDGDFAVSYPDEKFFITTGMDRETLYEFAKAAEIVYQASKASEICNEYIDFTKGQYLENSIMVKQGVGTAYAFINGVYKDCLIEVDRFNVLSQSKFVNCRFACEGKQYLLTDNDFVEIP